MKKIILFIVILVPMIALLYFGLTRDPRHLPSALIEKAAPDFTLQSLEGETFSLQDSRGHPIVFNFWSTWCGPCLAEHRLIQRMQKMYAPKGVLFYAVLYEDTAANAKQFIARYGKGAPILLDPGLRTAIDYGVAGIPETYFIDRNGKITYKHAGILTSQLIATHLKGLLEEGAHP